MANLQEIIPAFFVGPNGEPLTPEQIAQRQQVAQSLLQQATDTSPNAGGWASVLAKGVSGGLAGYKNRQAERAETANTEYNSGLLGSLFSGQAPASATPAYPSSVAAGGSSVGAVEPAAIKSGLLARGLPEHVADGFLMNFADESGFNPGINEQNPTVAGSRGGFGLYQLTGPRRKAYEQFASANGLPVDSTDAQLDFLVSELKGPEAGAAKAIFGAPDAGSAAAAIVNKFLRPAEEHRVARANKYITRPKKYAGIDDAPLVDAALSGEVAPMPSATVAEALAMPGGGALANSPSMIPAPGATPYSGPGAQSIAAGDPNPNRVTPIPIDPRVAVAGAVPQTQPAGADMPAGQPGEIRQGPDGQTYQYVETTNMAGATGSQGWIPVNSGAQPGAPMAQPPAQDITKVPALSAAADIPMVGPTGQPSVSAALAAPPPAPAVGSVAEALAIRPQADPNDRMVADAAHTLQPTQEELAGVFPAAPQQPDQSMQLQRVLADPRASPQTKQVALGLLQQQQRDQQNAAQAQREQQNWFAQQDYQQQQQANDPLRQAQIRKAQIDAQNAEANPRGEETFYGNPVAFTDKDGKIKYGQIGSKGSFKPIDIGEGQQFAPPTKQINTETEILTVNQAGDVIARQPIQNRQAAAETAGGAVEGKTEAERRIAAPADVQMGQNALDLLDQIEKHPARESTVGFGSYLSGVRGTPQFEFNNLVEQAKSGAFLTAIQQLRGFGSLSNAEGGAATAAVTRMNVADTKEGFMAALRDYRKIIEQGIDNAKKRVGPTADAPANAPVRRKFNPATGRIE